MANVSGGHGFDGLEIKHRASDQRLLVLPQYFQHSATTLVCEAHWPKAHVPTYYVNYLNG